ncbi:MAG TPA: tetratricopeptide repeat protein [Rudaea sp.]|nr:tetratricopeptide repeat protein [Rudaea sp.]
MTARLRTALVAFAATAIVAAVYWPVHDAALVWDDRFYLYDRAWLREGNQWLAIALHGFADWTNYFRPLGIALFTAEVRLFDTAAAPMHFVSLALHLANTLLVGMLGARMLGDVPRAPVFRAAAMLVYGLHPALVEPVAWISSQFDLLTALFTLLGMLANLSIANRWARAVAVAICFFCAACAKEAAAAFVPILFVVDWMRSDIDATGTRARLRRLAELQWPVYAASSAAGVAYLAFRHAGLGYLVSGAAASAPSFVVWFQTMCYTYLAYAKLLVWPMAGLAPMHLVATERFAAFDAESCAIDAAALVLAAATVFLFGRRKALGGLLAGFSAGLLPVLHILPIGFDESVFHERYATTAIAIACAFLPLASAAALRTRRSAGYAAFGAACWIALSIVNIRVTLPLWADEVRLWTWALQRNPGAVLAEDALLSTYVERNDIAHARPLADALLHDGLSCVKCMLNVAFLAILTRDKDRAAQALNAAGRSMPSAPPRTLVMGFLLASGNLAELNGRPDEAAQAYAAAIARDPQSPEARMNLALLQARRGDLEEARRNEAIALSLSTPDAAARRQAEFEAALAEPKTPPPE